MQQHAPQSAVNYWTYGNPQHPALVMVHGFTGSHEGFQYIVPLLKDDFYIVIPDLPGFGISPLPGKPWTAKHVADRTNDLVRELGLAAKPYLLSHSMGGLIAAYMLADAPELYEKKTIFVSPVATKVGALESRTLGALGGALQYRVGTLIPAVATSRLISRAATKVIMTTSDKKLQAKIYQHHYDNLDYVASSAYYYALQKDITGQGVADLAQQLKSFDVLIIAGDKDNVTPLAGEKKLADLLSARLEIIPDVGHLAHYETPSAIASAAADFLG